MFLFITNVVHVNRESSYMKLPNDIYKTLFLKGKEYSCIIKSCFLPLLQYRNLQLCFLDFTVASIPSYTLDFLVDFIIFILLSGGGGGSCTDSNPSCASWASRGECQSNPKYMLKSCKKSCNAC